MVARHRPWRQRLQPLLIFNFLRRGRGWVAPRRESFLLIILLSEIAKSTLSASLHWRGPSSARTAPFAVRAGWVQLRSAPRPSCWGVLQYALATLSSLANASWAWAGLGRASWVFVAQANTDTERYIQPRSNLNHRRPRFTSVNGLSEYAATR